MSENINTSKIEKILREIYGWKDYPLKIERVSKNIIELKKYKEQKKVKA